MTDWALESGQNGNRIFDGHFRIRRWLRRPLLVGGRIVEKSTLPTDVYLYDPPIFLRLHKHGGCFQLLEPQSQWFLMHWEKPAVDFERSRAHVEGLLNDAYRLIWRHPLRYAKILYRNLRT